MLRKTHLAIGLAAALHFLPHISNKIIFLPIVMIASVLPDIDSGFSRIGKGNLAKVLQATTHHRGIFHSYTLCLLFTLVLVFIYPMAALPFFLGYSFHLFADSFTLQGIRPFWPLKNVSAGKIKTGNKTEDVIFWVFVIVDVFLVLATVYSIFE